MSPRDKAAESVVLGTLCVVVLCSMWPTLWDFGGTWTTSGHGYFVAGLVGWMLWRDRGEILGSVGPGLPDLLPVLGLLSVGWLLTVVMHTTVLHEAFLVGIMTTWALATFGWQARRVVLSIGLTSLLAVPLWGSLVPVLQRATVIVSGGVTQLAGISAVIGYDFVSLTSGTFLIEEGCAGLNYLMGGLVLGAFYAHLFVRGWQLQLKVVLLAAAVSVVGNWIRVTTLIFIGEATRMESSLLEDHLWQGWVIFTLLMVPAYFLARRIERRDAERTDQVTPRSAVSAAEAASGPADPGRVRRAVMAGLVAMVGPILFMSVGAVPRGDVLDEETATLGLVGGWSVAVTPETGVPTWRPDFQGIDERASWSQRQNETEVKLVRHYFIDQRQGEELVQWGNRIAPDSLLVSERLIAPIGNASRMVQEAIVLTPDRPSVVWYWYRVAGFDTPFTVKAKLLEIVSFFRRSAASELVTLHAACDVDNCAVAAEALSMALGGGSLEPSP